MKRVYILILFLVVSQLKAQVGIQTTSPNAQLDVRSSNQATPSNTDGILIPKVDAFPAINPTAAQQGMLVYLTTPATFLATTRQPGFYYWDNTIPDWIGISTSTNGDHDWYEEGTTTPPNAITDDMFHTGNVAIGQNTADYPLEITTTNFDKGINTNFTSSTNNGNTKFAMDNTISGTSTDVHNAIRNTISSSGVGNNYGIRNNMTGTGAGIHIGTFNDILNGTGAFWGTYNRLVSTTSSQHYGVNNDISGGDGANVGVKNLIYGTNTIYDRGVENVLNGSGDAMEAATYNEIGNYGDGIHYGTYNNLNNVGDGNQFGTYTSLTNTGAGIHYGNYNLLSGNGTASGNQYGVVNEISKIGNSNHYGLQNLLSGGGSGSHYGIHNTLSGSGTGSQFGNYTSISNTADGYHSGLEIELTGNGNGGQYGVSTTIMNNGSSAHFGIANRLASNAGGDQYASFNIVSGTGNGVAFGTYNQLINSGTGDKFAVQNYISSLNALNIYGVKSDLTGNNNMYGSRINMINNNVSGLVDVHGTSTRISGSATGPVIGFDTEINMTSNGPVFGNDTRIYGSTTGTGTKYSNYNYINPTVGGTHYGIYSEVLKAGTTNFAGYFLGNVGIGTSAANTYTLPPSRGTNLQIMQTNATGTVSWQNLNTALNPTAWLTTGNSGLVGGNTTTAGTNFIGTTDNQNIDFRTNNIFRARISNLGEFFVGALNTVLTGDLMNGVGNVTFPWALNGYTDQNGAGTYGQVTAGATIFAGVQGEYNGTNTQGTGVRGIALTATPGTSFGAIHTGVTGNATTGGAYKFGVSGNGGTSARSGGVFGYDYGLAMGALGYYAASAVDYSVYGFGQAHTNGIATGRLSNDFLEKNTNIGLGIYGGVMGGWVRGMKFGFHTKGETYSLYVDGNGYTNKPLAYLFKTNDKNKVASFMSTSMHPEVTVNGKVNLENGKVFVAFDESFQQIISNIDDVIITASPQGKSNGVYIDQITKDGFWIYENNDGTSNIKVSWIAITKIKGEENPEVPKDILANDFDKKMDGVMFNENNRTDIPQSIWWDGEKIRWDKPTNDKVDTQTKLLARPK